MKRTFYNPDEFTRSYPFGHNILCFAEMQSKEDGVRWSFSAAHLDSDNDNGCVASFDLQEASGAKLRVRFMRKPGQQSDGYDIIEKTYTGVAHRENAGQPS